MSVTLYLRGDQIGTYQGAPQSSGNGADIWVRLNGVAALGGATDIFRVVVEQVNGGVGHFSNGQRVSIYTWSEADPDGTLVQSQLFPQHDQYQGRASGSTYQIFTQSAGVVFDVNGVTPGTMQYGPGDAAQLQAQLPFSAFANSPWDLVVPCFTRGTRIMAETGPRPVQALRPGDRVLTRDNGFQPVRWVGSRRVPAVGRLAPIRFAAGTVGNDRPLRLSPHHRLLVQDARLALLGEGGAALVEARWLVNGGTIRRIEVGTVDYHHLLLDRHEIVFAEGAPAETLYLGPMTGRMMSPAAMEELRAVFPDLDRRLAASRMAYPCLDSAQSRLVGA